MLEAVRSWVEQLLAREMDVRKIETIAHVVSGIIESKSVATAEIGRSLPGDVAAKHKIKRVDRFLGNVNVDVNAIWTALFRAFCFPSGLLVLQPLDWTHLGKFEGMSTSVVIGGRAIPFHWTIIDKNKTRMALAERRHVEELKAMLPDDVNCVLLFDAGFDNVSFLRHLDDLGLKYVVRCSPQNYIKPENEDWLNLNHFSMERSRVYDWDRVAFTKEHEFPVRFVALFDPGQKGPWYLATNLKEAQPRQITEYYGRRFETEETYKDLKDIRNGLQLKGTRIKTPGRLARLLAVQTIAYWFMVLAGLYGEEIGYHRTMQSSSTKNKRVLALWRVGRELLRRCIVQHQHLLGRFWLLLSQLSIKLGGRTPLCVSSG